MIKEILDEKEKLLTQIKEYENNKDKATDKKIKNKNAQFCELYQSFSNKKLLKYKFEMIVGMFVKQKEKEMKIKIKQLNEIIENLKKRNQVLTEENENLKDNEDEYIEEEGNERTQIESKYGTKTYNKNRNNQNRSNSYGLVRVIRRNKDFKANKFISVSKISYRRRNEN